MVYGMNIISKQKSVCLRSHQFKTGNREMVGGGAKLVTRMILLLMYHIHRSFNTIINTLFVKDGRVKEMINVLLYIVSSCRGI